MKGHVTTEFYLVCTVVVAFLCLSVFFVTDITKSVSLVCAASVATAYVLSRTSIKNVVSNTKKIDNITVRK